MLITATRSGGIAGVEHRLGPIDVGQLDPEMARRIEMQAASMDFFSLPTELPERHLQIRDAYRYGLTIEAHGVLHHVDYGTEATLESYFDPFRELLRLLRSSGARFRNENGEELEY